MSDQITTAFVKQFASGITIRAQQQGSNLRHAVDITSGITGDAVFFDQVSATSMSPLGARHSDTVLTDTPHHRRKCPILPFTVADMIDNPDMIRTLNNPTNPYVRQFGYAGGRQIDDIIISAFDADVATGVAGAGTDSFDTDFSIANGGTNLTTAKLRTARKLLEQAENPEDGGDNQWFVVCSAEQREAMLGDSEFQNNDFNSVRALVDGTVNTWLGFTFLKSERLPTDSSSITSCFAWRKSGMMLGVGAEGRGFIDVIPGKNHSTQVRYALDMGAVRMEQNAVIRIFCDDTA